MKSRSILSELLEGDRRQLLKKYKKTDSELEQCIQHLLEWKNKQPHLPDEGDETLRNKLIHSLLYNNFNTENVKKLLDVYYSVRSWMPVLFENWDVYSPEIQQALNISFSVPLRKLTPDLDRVSIAKLFDDNPEHYDPIASLKLLLMINELRIQKPDYCFGDQIIYDLKGYSLAHFMKVSPATIQKLYVLVKDTAANKGHGFHILNGPPILDKILAVFKCILKPKLYNRIHIHKSLESLHKLIPKEILPKDYGGTEPELDEIRRKWKQELENNRDWLLKNIEFKTDESKRIDKVQQDDQFGSIHGSFRKLEID